MPKIMINRRRRASASAIAFFAAHEGAIAAGLEERLSPLLRPGEDPVDFGLALKLLGRLVETGLDDLNRAEGDDSDDAPILELWVAAKDVNSQMVAFRRIFQGLYGVQRTNEVLDLQGPTASPEQLVLLMRQAHHLIERLRGTELEPPRHTASVELDVGAMVAELEPAVDRLVEAWNAALYERKKRDEKADAKSNAAKVFDTDYRDSVRLAASLARMAGLAELARRLKSSPTEPTRRRS